MTVLGPPGTGKTRFVRRFGALQVDAGDSAWFCDLTEARTEVGVLSAVATALGVPLTGKGVDEDALAERLGHAIAGRGRTWVLLDNAEQVVVHRSQVVPHPADVPPTSASLLACGVLTGAGDRAFIGGAELDENFARAADCTAMGMRSASAPTLFMMADRAPPMPPK